MKQRGYARAAKFLWPNFVQMIKWEQDWHERFLSHAARSRDAIGVLPLQRLLKLSPPYHAYRKHCEDGDRCTRLREKLPMSRVERQVVLAWDLDLTGKHAFSKRAAIFIP